MAAPTFSLPVVHERVQHLQSLVPPSTLLDEDARIESVAALIQEADTLLAQFPPESPGESLEVSVSRTLTQLVRSTAFALMQELNPDQAWFWTEAWQAGEREADADYAAGRYRTHESTDGFLAALEARE